MKKSLQIILVAAATTLVLAGCGKAETTEVTKMPLKDGSAKLVTSIDRLKGQLDTSKVKDAKKLG